MNKRQEDQRRIIFWSLELLIVATLVWVCTKISFVFRPVGTFISTLAVPLIISGFLFYLLNPLVNLLMKVHYKRWRLTRTLAVAIVFVVLIGLIALGASYLLPRVISQVEQLIGKLPHIITTIQHGINAFLSDPHHREWLHHVDVQQVTKHLGTNTTALVRRFMTSLTSSFGSLISAITNITVTIITVPFMLFYMLKDGYRLMPAVKRMVPKRHADSVEDLLMQMGHTISHYILGQAIECTFVGTFSALGYSLVGVPYGLLVGIFAGFTNIIPYIGPYIGLVPALILALTHSFKTAVLVIVVCIVVQQVDGNLIYPNVIGKTLAIHPLTIIVLLLVAGNIAGLPGMILGIPFYAVLKVVVQYCYHIYQLRYDEEKGDEHA